MTTPYDKRRARRRAIAALLREAGHDLGFSVAAWPDNSGTTVFEVIDGDGNGVLITKNERIARDLADLLNDIVLEHEECPNCGGTVQPIACAGRTFASKGRQNLPIPSDLIIPTCDGCGARWVDEEHLRVMSEAAELSAEAAPEEP